MEAAAALAAAFALGCAGQLVRALLGLRKRLADPARSDAYDFRLTAVSTALGGVAGLIASAIPGIGPAGVVAAGYAGADALEGLLAQFDPVRK